MKTEKRETNNLPIFLPYFEGNNVYIIGDYYNIWERGINKCRDMYTEADL